MRLLLLGFAILFTLNQAKSQSEGYSLKQCIEYSLENSNNMKNSRLDVQSALAEIGRIRSAGLPQINGSVGLNYNYEIRKTLIPASTFDPNAPDEEIELAFGTKYDGDANISLNQLIFDGSYFVGLQAAKMYKLYSEQQSKQSKIDVIDIVTKSYYMILINEIRYERVNSNLSRIKELLDNTTELYNAGFAEKIDVSRIQVSYNNLEVQEKSMKRLIDLSKMMLKLQMGMDLSEDLVLTEKIEDLPGKLEEQVNSTDFNYINRIDYQLLNSGKQLTELDLKNYRVQRLPSLYLVGVYGRNTNTNNFDNYFEFGNRWLSYGVIGVQMNIPIFDGLGKRYSIQKSKIELEKIENNRDILESSIQTEIKQKEDALTNSLEMMEVQKQNYELANEVYETTNSKYQEGLGSNLEVIEANNDLIDAQSIYYDALYNAVVAKTELEKALGLYNEY